METGSWQIESIDEAASVRFAPCKRSFPQILDYLPNGTRPGYNAQYLLQLVPNEEFPVMSTCVSQTLETFISGAPSREMAMLTGAARALAHADGLDEIKQIRDKAEAVRQYARSAALGQAVQNDAAELKLRAERKAGQLLRSMRLRGGDRKSSTRPACLKLEDLGINKDQSARWQLQSQVPADQFDAYLKTTRESGGEIAAADVLRLARTLVPSRRTCNSASSPTGNTNLARQSTEDRRPATTSGIHQTATSLERARRVDLLTEVQNHRGLLDNILRPVYSGGASELSEAELRIMKRLLSEMGAMLSAIQQENP